MASSAQALAAGGFGGSEECRRIPGDFDRFVQGELESFRRTCDADYEKMEILEQVSSQPYHCGSGMTGSFSPDECCRSSRSNSRARSRITLSALLRISNILPSRQWGQLGGEERMVSITDVGGHKS